ALGNLKETLNPRENENFLIIEIITIALLAYYDFLIQFSIDKSIEIYSLILLLIYAGGLIYFYVIARENILEFGFQEYFTYYSQIIFSLFLGVLSCLYYFLIETKEVIGYIICTIPLIFLLAIYLLEKLSLFQIEKFLRRYIVNDEIWNELEGETRRDFKQAETSVRANNIANAIINICKGLERELKAAIFEPFKRHIEESENKDGFFKIKQPFPPGGSDPRQRTYYNFKNYLQGKRHLTFGNIPFFLLNLTDKKIHHYTPLFTRFADFLKKRFQDHYENVILISKTLFNHNFFTVEGIKISDLRNEAAHPQKRGDRGNNPTKSDEILSTDNYITLLKILTLNPKLLKLIVDLKT
ncbi:MAG: hypothetical protein ACOC4M_18385, partial [Promethearchaeia archaeon]